MSLLCSVLGRIGETEGRTARAVGMNLNCAAMTSPTVKFKLSQSTIPIKYNSCKSKMEDSEVVIVIGRGVKWIKTEFSLVAVQEKRSGVL